MGVRVVSGMFMDWPGIVSIPFRPVLGTSLWVSRAEGPARDSCLVRLTRRFDPAGICKEKNSHSSRKSFRPPGAYSDLENSTDPSCSLTWTNRPEQALISNPGGSFIYAEFTLPIPQ